MAVSPGYLSPIDFIGTREESTEFSEDGHVIKYKVKPRYPLEFCPECVDEAVLLGSNGNAEVKTIRDLPSGGRRVVFEVYSKRYKCPKCKKTFGDELGGIFDGQLTVRLRNHLVDRVLRRDTFTKIAADYGVSDQTVRRAFNTWTKRNAWQLQYETPRVLGVDEAHIDRHYRLLIVDVEKRLPIDVLKNNKSETIINFIRSLPNKGNVEAVTMDFKADYAIAVEKAFAGELYHPKIVIDHFHVIQDINRKMDAIRKKVQAELGEKPDEIEEEDWWLYGDDSEEDGSPKKLKKEKRLFMTNIEDLGQNEMSRLSFWMRRDKRLEDAYFVKEGLRDIYKTAVNSVDAGEAFDRWRAAIPENLPEFVRCATYFNQRRVHILNYFDTRVTNAFTEGANRVMKDIEQSGRGYDFEMLRKIVLFSFRNPREELLKVKYLTFKQDRLQ